MWLFEWVFGWFGSGSGPLVIGNEGQEAVYRDNRLIATYRDNRLIGIYKGTDNG